MVSGRAGADVGIAPNGQGLAWSAQGREILSYSQEQAGGEPECWVVTWCIEGMYQEQSLGNL